MFGNIAPRSSNEPCRVHPDSRQHYDGDCSATRIEFSAPACMLCGSAHAPRERKHLCNQFTCINTHACGEREAEQGLLDGRYIQLADGRVVHRSE